MLKKLLGVLLFSRCSTAILCGGSVPRVVVRVERTNGTKALQGAQHVATEMQRLVVTLLQPWPVDGQGGCCDVSYSWKPRGGGE